MIKAEILTDYGQYEVKLPDAKDLHDAWMEVHNLLGAGQYFPGDGELLEIGVGASIKHIRIYDDQQVKQVSVDAPQPRQNGNPESEITNWLVEYLGQDLKIRILLVHDIKGGGTVAMPIAINDSRPGSQLRPDSQKGLMLAWMKENGGYWSGRPILIMVPEGDLEGPDDYLEYARDYIKETSKPRPVKDKNAKAWTGWGAADKP